MTRDSSLLARHRQLPRVYMNWLELSLFHMWNTERYCWNGKTDFWYSVLTVARCATCQCTERPAPAPRDRLPRREMSPNPLNTPLLKIYYCNSISAIIISKFNYNVNVLRWATLCHLQFSLQTVYEINSIVEKSLEYWRSFEFALSNEASILKSH